MSGATWAGPGGFRSTVHERLVRSVIRKALRSQSASMAGKCPHLCGLLRHGPNVLVEGLYRRDRVHGEADFRHHAGSAGSFTKVRSSSARQIGSDPLEYLSWVAVSPVTATHVPGVIPMDAGCVGAAAPPVAAAPLHARFLRLVRMTERPSIDVTGHLAVSPCHDP